MILPHRDRRSLPSIPSRRLPDALRALEPAVLARLSPAERAQPLAREYRPWREDESIVHRALERGADVYQLARLLRRSVPAVRSRLRHLAISPRRPAAAPPAAAPW